MSNNLSITKMWKPMPLFQKWDNFGGTIESVQDIEENIWMPQLGLKGKVDVGVRVRKRTPGGVEVVKTIPMELKTGRATFSLEHRGQLTLYQMMMGEFHRDTESGLLLYLREGILRELQPTWNEVRDLIMMRNRFIGYLASEKIYMNDEEPEFKLPEPISHPTACSSCPLNTICSVFLLKSDQKDLVTPQHYLHKVLEKVTEHLSEMDADYFINWVHIVFYEHFHEHETFSHERIWTKTPEAREVEGFTLAYLVILTNPTLQGNRYVTEFHVDKSRPGGSKRDCLTAGFSLGDYLIVSTSQKIAVATGTVLSIDPWSICLSLERDLRALYRHEVFHIDRFESKMSMTFNLTNLGAMLENTERSNELRRLIVEKIPPKGSPEVQRITHEAFWNLNDDQMDAIVKSVHLQEYMLLEGLPGTGKTETIIAIVRYFHRQGKSVLITSHTNAAVDNFLERLIPFDVPFMRLGSVSRISPKLHHYTESFLTRECSTVDDLDVAFYRCGIVGVTCMGCNHPLLIQRQFDLCIVDEAIFLTITIQKSLGN
uniref:DNA helicase n=1 Tax=Phlebotomus papatasi TaxID=29031 RepID=A0A1B0GPP2_PHLPP